VNLISELLFRQVSRLNIFVVKYYVRKIIIYGCKLSLGLVLLSLLVSVYTLLRVYYYYYYYYHHHHHHHHSH
jgi:hypothetical protein